MGIFNSDVSLPAGTYNYLSGWWFGTFFLFSPIVGMMIQSDELHHFSGG
jgi:hypothetical protein